MRKLNTLFAVAVVALGAQLASAGIVIETIEMTPPFGAPDAALTGFKAWQVNAAATGASELISAVDVAFAGQLHQRWSDTNFDGVPDPTPQGPAANGRGDSHLTPLTGALVGSAPTENNNVLQSPLPDTATFDYGIGDSMSGAWGIPGPSQGGSATLGYVVIPDGQTVNLTWAIATSVDTFSGVFAIGDGGVVIPEPATLAMCGMGMIGLVLRRRNG